GVAFFAVNEILFESLSEIQRAAFGIVSEAGTLNAHQATLRSQRARSNRYGWFHRTWPPDGARAGGDGRERRAVRAKKGTMRNYRGRVTKSGCKNDGPGLRREGSGQHN